MYPIVSDAVPPTVCVPLVIFFHCHVAEQELAPGHVLRVLPSAWTAVDATVPPIAETTILTLLLPVKVVPFDGELTVTLTWIGVVTDRPIGTEGGVVFTVGVGGELIGGGGEVEAVIANPARM